MSAQKKNRSKSVPVAIVMGSDSDLKVMAEAKAALDHFGVACEMSIVSAHRTPKEMVTFAEGACKNGFQVIIAGAGGAAHLPGMIAALTVLPVIGVPVPVGSLQGNDALLSIVQMPKGVPVATVAIGGAWNAGLLAVQILGAAGVGCTELQERIAQYKDGLRQTVLKKRL